MGIRAHLSTSTDWIIMGLIAYIAILATAWVFSMCGVLALCIARYDRAPVITKKELVFLIATAPFVILFVAGATLSTLLRMWNAHGFDAGTELAAKYL